MFVGGGAGEEQKLGRLVRDKVVFADVPPLVLTMFRTWQDEAPNQTFQAYTAGLSDDDLRRFGAREPEMAA